MTLRKNFWLSFDALALAVLAAAYAVGWTTFEYTVVFQLLFIGLLLTDVGWDYE